MDHNNPESSRGGLARVALNIANALSWALTTGLRVLASVFSASDGRGDAAAPPSTSLYKRRKEYRP